MMCDLYMDIDCKSVSGLCDWSRYAGGVLQKFEKSWNKFYISMGPAYQAQDASLPLHFLSLLLLIVVELFRSLSDLIVLEQIANQIFRFHHRIQNQSG